MPDEPTTSTEPNLENYVPKQDHDKALTDKDATISQLKSDINRARDELLTPDYLDFIESKKAPTKAQKTLTQGLEDLSSSDIDKMSNRQLLSHIEERTGQQTKGLLDEIKNLRSELANMTATRELDKAKRNHPDFDEYEDEIKSIYQRVNIPYEDAYLLAKQMRLDKKGDSLNKSPNNTPNTPRTPSMEKPSGGVPRETVEKKNYKTDQEAGDAAWEEMKEKYPDLGDSL